MKFQFLVIYQMIWKHSKQNMVHYNNLWRVMMLRAIWVHISLMLIKYIKLGFWIYAFWIVIGIRLIFYVRKLFLVKLELINNQKEYLCTLLIMGWVFQTISKFINIKWYGCHIHNLNNHLVKKHVLLTKTWFSHSTYKISKWKSKFQAKQKERKSIFKASRIKHEHWWAMICCFLYPILKKRFF